MLAAVRGAQIATTLLTENVRGIAGEFLLHERIMLAQSEPNITSKLMIR
jgi:hypothetical protein